MVASDAYSSATVDPERVPRGSASKACITTWREQEERGMGWKTYSLLDVVDAEASREGGRAGERRRVR